MTMKHLIFVLMIMIPFITAAQKKIIDLPQVDGETAYKEVVTVDSVSKDQLFDRAKMWLAKHYNSANDVIQVADKEGGQLLGKGIFDITVPGLIPRQVNVHHTLSISVKDGRYMYVINSLRAKFYNEGEGEYNFPVSLEYPKNLMKGFYRNVCSLTDEEAKETAASLKKAMVSPITEDF